LQCGLLFMLAKLFWLEAMHCQCSIGVCALTSGTLFKGLSWSAISARRHARTPRCAHAGARCATALSELSAPVSATCASCLSATGVHTMCFGTVSYMSLIPSPPLRITAMYRADTWAMMATRGGQRENAKT
jgi:hypothetical protein